MEAGADVKLGKRAKAMRGGWLFDAQCRWPSKRDGLLDGDTDEPQSANDGRSTKIRTLDPRFPKPVLYQAELHSDVAHSVSLFRRKGQGAIATVHTIDGEHASAQIGA